MNARTQDSLERLAIGCFVLFALVHVAFVFASQAPSSPYRLALFPGPLEDAQWLLAFLTGATLLLSRFSALVLPSSVVATGTLGAGLMTTVSLISAKTGMLGFQLADPRPYSLTLFLVRCLGELCLALFFGFALWGVRSKRGS